MKVVSFDPMCNFSGGKATEWVPVIPGIDGMVALSMCHVIVNELGKYDEAVKAYDYAVLINPEFSSAHFNMGNSFISLKEYFY